MAMRVTIYKRSDVDMLGNLVHGTELTAIEPEPRRHLGAIGTYELPEGWRSLTADEWRWPDDLSESGPRGPSGIVGPDGTPADIMRRANGDLVLTGFAATGTAALISAVAPGHVD